MILGYIANVHVLKKQLFLTEQSIKCTVKRILVVLFIHSCI